MATTVFNEHGKDPLSKLNVANAVLPLCTWQLHLAA